MSVVGTSAPTIRVLRYLLQNPETPHWGHELARDSEVSAGSVYGILRRLERHGWLTATWDLPNEEASSRSATDPPGPPRKLYVLTTVGRQWAQDAVDEWRAELKWDPASAQGTGRPVRT